MSAKIEGVGADAPMCVNEKGGKQSASPYRCDLLPTRSLLHLAAITEYGSRKYGDWNWLKLSTSEHLNHALTHVFAHLAGDTQDDHIGHAAWRMVSALETELRKAEEKPKFRKRVYVAGPISRGDLRENIKRGTDAAVELMKIGYAPLCPHLSAYMGGDTPEVMPCGTTHNDWMDTDLTWVAVADAVLRLPGESVGADKEVALAEACGIPVFHSFRALLKGLPPS